MKTKRERITGSSKSFVGQMFFKSRIYRLLLTNGAAVVQFHRVNNTGEGDGLTCSVKMFERCCKFFAGYFEVISLRKLVEKLEIGARLNRELVITFDDGYRDNYEYAAPVLKAMGLPATFFVVSGFIGTERVAWWDKSLRTPPRWMTWDEIRTLHGDGFEIGAHTRTHANLGEVFGEKAWEEILGCRRDLEQKVSASIDLFAYPYGKESDITDENREIIKAAGFRCCCSGIGGINGAGTNPFHLRRIPITPWYASAYHFGCELALGHV